MQFTPIDLTNAVLELRNDIYEQYKITLNMEYDDMDNGIIIDTLEKRKPKNDAAGAFAMWKVTSFADKHGLDIDLIASESYGTELGKLIKFYEGFGFRKVDDYPGGDIWMKRDAQ
jgi:hypothetical protein